jgi:adenosylmethionine-8-amino-7-oxononanoate aminotransferase
MKAARTVRNVHSRVTGTIEQHAGAFPQGHTYTAHQVRTRSSFSFQS